MNETANSQRKAIRLWVIAAGMALVLTGQAFGQANTWITKAPMPTPRCCLAAGVIDGILYAVGGITFSLLGTVEAYDPKTNTWSTKSPLPTPRTGLAAAAVDGILYVVGGTIPSGGISTALLEAYNPKTNAWTTKAPLPTPRVVLGAGIVDGQLYAVGGLNSSGVLGTVEVYDPKTNAWSTKAPMTTPRYGLAVGVVEGILYAVGGGGVIGFPDGVAGTLEAYDSKTNTWTSKTPMPTPRVALGVVTVDGQLYAMGGWCRTEGECNLVEVYDPKTNAWHSKPPMPTARQTLAAGVLQDTIYAVGGYTNRPLAVNEAFSPFLSVSIDIKPGDPRNTISRNSLAIVRVAILSSASFGATTVDPATVTLAGAPVITQGRGTPLATFADINRDRRLDLLVHFRARDLALSPSDTEAVLKGTTFSCQRIRGVDSVRLVP